MAYDDSDDNTDTEKTEVKQETDFLNLLLPSSNSIADDDFQGINRFFMQRSNSISRLCHPPLLITRFL